MLSKLAALAFSVKKRTFVKRKTDAALKLVLKGVGYLLVKMQKPSALTALKVQMLVAAAACRETVGAFTPVLLALQNSLVGKGGNNAVDRAFADSLKACKHLIGGEAFIGVICKVGNYFIFLLSIVSHNRKLP